MTLKQVVMLCGCGVAATAGGAQAATITFNDLPTGSFVGSQYFESNGVLIAADNRRADGPDVATLVNTNSSNNQDQDLEFRGQWAGGNAQSQELGNVLIIAENVVDSNGNGRIDRPDDERAGGRLFFTFTQPIGSFGLDVVDMETVGNSGSLNSDLSSIEFYNNGVLVRDIRFSEFQDPESDFHDDSVEYGPRTANRLDSITARQLGATQFTAVVVDLNTSHAIDTIRFEPAVLIPEPSTLGLLIGLPGLAMLRRRRR